MIPEWVSGVIAQLYGGGPVTHISEPSGGGHVLAADIFDQGEPPSPAARIWKAGVADLKVGQVCGKCNGEWLSDLEGGTKLVLTPAILGAGRVMLSPVEQTLVARWAIKTATMAQFLQSQNGIIMPEWFQWIMHRDSPPPASAVWLAAYKGTAHAYLQIAHRQLLPPPEDRRSYPLDPRPLEPILTTLSLGRLIVLTLQFPYAEQDVAIDTSNNLANFIVALWPLPGFNVRWPPLLGVGDSGLLKLAGALDNGLIKVYGKTDVTRSVFLGGPPIPRQ